MKLHLDYIPQPAPFHIDHHSGILLCGSCFSDNIGSLLLDHRFNASVNPLGLFFNPASLSDALKAVLAGETSDNKLIVKRDDMYVSYLHHSRLRAEDPASLDVLINSKRKETYDFLMKAQVLILTFGTAYIYRLKENKKIVANCHKQPGTLFTKYLLSVSEIVSDYRDMIKNLQSVNPSIQIIFTVSPVKYLKDGVEQNTLSKATLCLAVHELVKEQKNCSYFPSYELIADDLRDYRFYKADLAHPSEQAIQYVWEKFGRCYFSENTRKENLAIAGENRLRAHRPL